MQSLRWWGSLCGFLLMVSCASSNANNPEQMSYYLDDAVNKEATQKDVTAHLGPPHFMQELTDGDTIWLYQYCLHSMNGSESVLREGRNGVATKQPTCIRYHLLFSLDKMLQDWRQQEY